MVELCARVILLYVYSHTFSSSTISPRIFQVLNFVAGTTGGKVAGGGSGGSSTSSTANTLDKAEERAANIAAQEALEDDTIKVI